MTKKCKKRGKTKKPKNLREKNKYPALNKGVNLSSRQEYIEPDYINGVINSKGDLVIRPLTDEEKEFLNQFYEESVVTNFYHDPELKKLNRMKRAIIEDDVVKELQDTVKEMQAAEEPDKKRIQELKQIIRLTKKQNEETYADKLEDIEEELQELREKKLLYPDKNDHKQFYNENNARNNCIYNKMKSMGKLIMLEPEEYDMFVSKKLQGLDAQYATIYEIERERYEEEAERLEKIFEEEREAKKKSKS